jgi:hypothetical protein
MLWNYSGKINIRMRLNRFLNKASLLIIASILTFTIGINAQKSGNDKKEQKSAEISSLIQSKNFVFVAQYALPLGGRSINLTSRYDVRLSKDTVVSDLPFYGRAFVAPMDPSEGGIRFTSTQFDYNVSEKKKGGWDITVLPKDTKDVRQMFLSVSENGYASLQVTSNNRQSINYTGYITSSNKRI